MESLCAAMDRGDLEVTIVCVISNNSKAPILQRARLKQIPAFHISGKTHPGSETAALLEIFEKQNVDALILAGYMKKLPDEIVLRYTGRTFNIHPALLPSFRWSRYVRTPCARGCPGQRGESDWSNRASNRYRI